MQCVLYTSAAPGVVSAQVEAPEMYTECAHILCHLYSCGAPGLFLGETTLFCAASLIALGLVSRGLW